MSKGNNWNCGDTMDMSIFINNQMIYNYYRSRLIGAARAEFYYEGIPKACDRDFFETKNLFDGKAMFCIPEILVDDTEHSLEEKIFSLGIAPTTRPSIYGKPLKCFGVGWTGTEGEIPDDYSANGKSEVDFSRIETKDFVVCYDNINRECLIPYIDMYAGILWEVHQTMRSNLKHQNKPYMVKTSEDTALTVDNFFIDWANFKPYVKIKSMGKKNRDEDPKTFNLKDIDVMDLRVQFLGSELAERMRFEWANALSMLGITSQYSKKAEYQNTDQLQLDKLGDDISLATRLIPRIEFCNAVNEKWGLNMSVHLSPMTKAFQDAITAPLDMMLAEAAGLTDKDDTTDPTKKGGNEDE